MHRYICNRHKERFIKWLHLQLERWNEVQKENEKKFKTLEKERPDEMEVAEKEDQEGQKET